MFHPSTKKYTLEKYIRVEAKENLMSASDVIKMIKDDDVQFVDFRFLRRRQCWYISMVLLMALSMLACLLALMPWNDSIEAFFFATASCLEFLPLLLLM